MATLVTDSLSVRCFVELIDMTQACEDSNLLRFVTVADVDAEKHVDDGLVQIWKMKLDQKVQKYSQTLSTRFGQDFEVEV